MVLVEYNRVLNIFQNEPTLFFDFVESARVPKAWVERFELLGAQHIEVVGEVGFFWTFFLAEFKLGAINLFLWSWCASLLLDLMKLLCTLFLIFLWSFYFLFIHYYFPPILWEGLIAIGGQRLNLIKMIVFCFLLFIFQSLQTFKPF